MSVQTGLRLLETDSVFSRLSRDLNRPIDPGAFLGDMANISNGTMERMTADYGLPRRYADAIRIEPDLPSGVLGAQYVDSKNRWVVYNPDVATMHPSLRDYVAQHEGIHLGQPIEELYPLILTTDLEVNGVRLGFHLGRALIEGFCECDVERYGKRMGAYETLYRMGKDILKILGTSTEQVYRNLEYNGPRQLVDQLNSSNVYEIAYQSLLKMTQEKGLNNMLVEGWLVPLNYGKVMD